MKYAKERTTTYCPVIELCFIFMLCSDKCRDNESDLSMSYSWMGPFSPYSRLSSVPFSLFLEWKMTLAFLPSGKLANKSVK